MRAALVAAGTLAFGASPAFAANLIVAPRKASFGCAQQQQFKTISAAIAAARAGDQITVCPGTYQEQLLINKPNLTLQVQGNNAATIMAPQAMNSSGAIIKITTTNVKITGFTLTNSGVASGNRGALDYGVYIVNGGSADLENDNIANINDDPLSANQRGVAVEAGDSNIPSAGSVTLKHDTIENYQKNGVTVDGVGSIADIENNVITGSGPTSLLAQNGIQISNGANATIKNNTVMNNAFSPGSFTATGILLFAAGRTDAEQNTFTTDDTGIYDFAPTVGPVPPTPPGGPNSPGGNTTIAIMNNQISDGTFDGIVVDTDTSGAQVQNNSLSGTWGFPAYGVGNGDGIGVFASTGAQIQSNQATANSEDGLFANSDTSGNSFQSNQSSDNAMFDCQDETGTTPSTIANTWQSNRGDLSLPAFLCQGDPSVASAARASRSVTHAFTNPHRRPSPYVVVN
jgi:hypothetical protein